MKKINFLLSVVFFILTLTTSTINSFGYTSNSEIAVVREMPSGGIAGDTITIEVTVYVGDGITGQIRGFYLTDEIPGGLSIETGSYTASLNGLVLPNVTEETGAMGEVYPGFRPHRLILEIPPDFVKNNPLNGGDELVFKYDVTIPGDANAGDVYIFPGHTWVGRMQSNPAEDIFGYEELPEFALTVLPMAFRITNITQDWADTYDVTIAWASESGLSYDISIKDDFAYPFNQVDTVTASDNSTSWTDNGSWTDGTHPTEVGQRYYKVSYTGMDSQNIVGMFKIMADEGMNLISLPLIPFSTALTDVIGIQAVGADNEGDADQVWMWNGSNYEFAWLVDGLDPPNDIYNGTWFSATGMTLGAEQGAWIQVKEGHGSQDVYLLGEVSSDNRTILLSPGMNLVGTCFPVAVELGDQASGDSNLWESGATGATNEGDADQVWTWIGSNFEFHWLVDGLDPPNDIYNGTWYPPMLLEPGKGYFIQVRYDGFVWTYPIPY